MTSLLLLERNGNKSCFALRLVNIGVSRINWRSIYVGEINNCRVVEGSFSE